MLSGVSAGNSGMVFRIVIAFDPNGVNDRSCDCGFVDFVLEKNYIQTMFFAILILVVPIVLKLLGFEFAGWGSVYPLYSWTALR